MRIRELQAAEYEPEADIALFWDYWRQLQLDADGSVPWRVDFDPAKVSPILPNMTISDYVGDHYQLVRLIGTAHERLWPPNITGRNLFDFLEDAIAEARRAIFTEMINRPCGCHVMELVTDGKGNTLPYAALILPLLSPQGSPTVFMGCYNYLGDGMDLIIAAESGIVKRVTVEAWYIDLHVNTEAMLNATHITRDENRPLCGAASR